MYRMDKSMMSMVNEAEPSANKPRLDSSPTGVKALGLCLGASTLSLVQVESEQAPLTDVDSFPGRQPRIVSHWILPHEGNPRQTLMSVFSKLDLSRFDRIVATGRKFRKFVRFSSISEPEAVEYAYQFVRPAGVRCPAIVSAGGETTMVYLLDRGGRIAGVLTGNKCASGTGEFFLQQLRRMDVSLETATQWAATQIPYHVSGRCSVFCKSDCTHATNKGVPKARVTAGLCKMMANKVLALLKKVERKDIMIVGGTARNRMMVEYLQQEIVNLIVPDEAPYFEALGAALWGLVNETIPFSKNKDWFASEATAFDIHPPLEKHAHLVTFKEMLYAEIQSGDECLLGLDVGSTTTKAVLIREKDNALLASEYLRTNGDPVGASRLCYRSLWGQVANHTDPSRVLISGLGVCGSGRQIAGLHALTNGIMNEIIAHAAAAVYFDPQVDTLFEIGGQDAKYTYITNGVPSDYAMNEACSAGTGSFLEESAFETMGVEMQDIADIAVQGRRPPNFNDQCAAFIASDIKNAIHEGMVPEDIIAGLIYSICMNYANRVKGNRPVGVKIFMQGGVCYNRAVPLAMAGLIGKPIVVPPHPGLMGAYGAALEVKKKIRTGLLDRRVFDLKSLAEREVNYHPSFICGGGKEKCDRRCEIAIVEIEGRKYPFGGACNRYYNLRHDIRYDSTLLDFVRIRQELVFKKYGSTMPMRSGKYTPGRIAINRSFLVNSFFPLYSTFFTELGLKIVMPEIPSPRGIDQISAAFCYPGELAHGFFYELLEMSDPPEFIFLPHFKAIPDQAGDSSSQVCPFVQGETFFLQATFKKYLLELKRRGTVMLTPLLDLTHGLENARKPLLEAGAAIGVSGKAAQQAFDKALQQQLLCQAEMKKLGGQILAMLEEDPEKIAIVIFGRPYNAFAEEAHMGVPKKLATRGVLTLPFDFLTLRDEPVKPHMYWGMGQLILKAAGIVAKHPQLFGLYITNFSCGPDSFIIGYFRDMMGRKPSLTLELDSHTADAGIETRIEAFMDIIDDYRQLTSAGRKPSPTIPFAPCRTRLLQEIPEVVTSSGEILPMTDQRMTLLFPSMGSISTEAIEAVFRGKGFNVFAHPPADEAVLKLGRANTSCKECLPLILTTGTLLNYVFHRKKHDEIVVYFMPTGSGPCRFGQYYIFMEDLIKRLQLPNVAVLSLTSEKSYAGLGVDYQRRGWWAIVVSDLMEDIRSMLLADAKNVESAQKIFQSEWQKILKLLESGSFSRLEAQLCQAADIFSRIPTRRSLSEVPKIFLTGEIFVRRDGLSRQYLTERLARNGIATICSPIAEWIMYSDYLRDSGLVRYKMPKMEKLEFMLKKKFMAQYEKRIKSALNRSGLIHAEMLNIESIIGHARGYIAPDLTGEAILTVGSSIAEVAETVCGVIAIGPFGCMPNRLSESILSEVMKRDEILTAAGGKKPLLQAIRDIEEMPFISIESDGAPFPQLIEAKLEAFCLRAERLHRKMQEAAGRLDNSVDKNSYWPNKPDARQFG